MTATRPAWVSAFTTTTGANIAGYMTINQADTGFVAETVTTLKIRVQDLLSLQSYVETIFHVNVFHKCSRNSFSISDQSDVEYEIAVTGTTPAVSIPISTVTGATAGCPLQYTLEILDYPTNTWIQVVAANVLSSYQFIVAAPPADMSTNAFQI